MFETLKLTLVSFVSDEAFAAFVEASGGSLIDLSINNVEKVSDLPTLYCLLHILLGFFSS